MSRPDHRIQTVTKSTLMIAVLLSSLAPAHRSSAQISTFKPEAFSINLKRVVTGLDQLIQIVDPNDGTGRMFIVERVGYVRILENGLLLDRPFLDISGQISQTAEQGLLSIVFHPDFRNNREFFIDYTDKDWNTQIERWIVSKDDPNRADPASAASIMTIEHPGATHNGGLLLFGPDGFLYIGHGDGGFQGDPRRNGQNLRTLLGKILRIDVDNPVGNVAYRIPIDNPFVNEPGARGEIWAYGLRNPWRFSFDRNTGDLYIADVGNDEYEEVNFVPAGEGGKNFGWVAMEGPTCFKVECDPNQFDLPFFWYTHSDENGCAITGGYVYRGDAIPELSGAYLAGDYCSGALWAINPGTGKSVAPALTGLQISSFGERADGELFVVDYNGEIFQIVP